MVSFRKILFSPHGRKLSLEKPRVMAILNVTPDSFYDGGKFYKTVHAVAYAQKLIEAGAHILDIGGESTAPGSQSVEAHEEILRIIPVIEAIRSFRDPRFKKVWISVDTSKAIVAKRAIEVGADMVNDVTALRGDPEMAPTLAELKAPIVLMYAKDPTPRTSRKKIRYREVIMTVKHFLQKRIRFALRHGIRRSHIILDPGMGAFVSAIPKYSFEILRRLFELQSLGYPICVGPSMKSFLGGKTIEDRKIPSIFAAWFAAQNGASILRVHHTDIIPFLRTQAEA